MDLLPAAFLIALKISTTYFSFPYFILFLCVNASLYLRVTCKVDVSVCDSVRVCVSAYVRMSKAG